MKISIEFIGGPENIEKMDFDIPSPTIRIPYTTGKFYHDKFGPIVLEFGHYIYNLQKEKNGKLIYVFVKQILHM